MFLAKLYKQQKQICFLIMADVKNKDLMVPLRPRLNLDLIPNVVQEVCTAKEFTPLYPLGQGSFCYVWQVQDNNNRPAALKVSKEEKFLPAQHTPRLVAESELQQKVHKLTRERFGISLTPEVYDAKSKCAEHRSYILMEPYSKESCLSGTKIDDTLEILITVRTLARALSCLHEFKIIHRDVKRRNCYRSGILGDFGSAVADDRRFHGAVGYSSPEQLNGNLGDEDYKSDVFSLGVVTYKLWTGEEPFRTGSLQIYQGALLSDEAPELKKKIPGISNELNGVVAAMLSYSSQNRPDLETVIGCMTRAM